MAGEIHSENPTTTLRGQKEGAQERIWSLVTPLSHSAAFRRKLVSGLYPRGQTVVEVLEVEQQHVEGREYTNPVPFDVFLKCIFETFNRGGTPSLLRGQIST
jgi:hypothetical protein